MAIFTIISNTNATRSAIKDLYEFLVDFKNFKSILPEDKVENFQFSETECSFAINGITSLTIRRVEQHPYSTILFSSEGMAKFNFNLQVFFDGEALPQGTCRVELSGDINPFIKSMAEKPLTNLVNTMSQKLSELTLS